jgi:glycosyltransferase involved in cell wall biosynthesis
MSLKVCVLNIGVPHAYARTLAISKFCCVELFVELGKYSPEKIHQLNLAGIPTVIKRKKGLNAIQLSKYLKEHTKADFYICHYAKGIHVDACIYARVPHIVVIGMGSDILNDDLLLIEKIKRKHVLRSVDMLIAKSDILREKVRKYAPNLFIEVNYWGESKDSFYPISKNDARSILGYEANIPIFLSTRSFSTLYNIDIIARTFVILKNLINDCVFLFAGNMNDDVYLENVKQILVDGGIKNFEFLNIVSTERLNLLYNASDVIFSFASREGMPNTMFEVFACKGNLLMGRIDAIERFKKETGARIILSNFMVNEIFEHSVEMIRKIENGSIIEDQNVNYDIFEKCGNIEVNAKIFIDLLENTVFPRKKRRIFTLYLLTLLTGIIRRVSKYVFFKSYSKIV